jgi:hypothetical protein
MVGVAIAKKLITIDLITVMPPKGPLRNLILAEGCD